MLGIPKTRTHLALILACGLCAASLAPPALAGPDCTCRHSGGEVNEGQTACIKGPSGMTMARCSTVLNNTSWQLLDQPCPYSALPGKPTIAAGNSTQPDAAMSLASLANGFQD